MHFSIKIIFHLLVALTLIQSGYAQDCNRDKANQLYNASINATTPIKEENLLKQALRLCPTHAHAFNNLALIRENQQQWRQAEKLYFKAVQVDPTYITAYAGLGDVRVKNKDYRAAAVAYRTFLTLLEADKGAFQHLRKNQTAYEEKLNKILTHFQAKGIVSSNEIKQTLNYHALPKISIRGFGEIVADLPIQPQIDLKIQFKTDSAALSPLANQQIRNLATALKSNSLKNAKIQLEGHTDSTGTNEYNLQLSKKRAKAVKKLLVQQGVVSSQLTTRGLGENYPLVSNDSPQGRIINRRVTVVNTAY